MKILALDLATVTGFAYGEAGTTSIRSGSVRLKRSADPREVACHNALAFLRDQIFTFDAPELVVVESFLNPAGQPSADAAILQLMLHGVALGMAQAYGARVESVAAATWRVHFIGRGTVGGGRGQPRTSKQKADDRAELKRLAVKRAQLLGYIPRDCNDDDRAEACGIFDYASATFARRTPESLVLFGEQPQ